MLTKALRPLPEKWHGLQGPRSPAAAALPAPHHRPDGPRRTSRRAPPCCGRSAASSTTGGSWRWRRLSCRPWPAGRWPSRSRRTTTRSTPTSSCGSRWSCTSSACWWAASSASTRSAGTSATRASTASTTRSSRCSSCTRRTATTTTMMRIAEDLIRASAQALKRIAHLHVPRAGAGPHAAVPPGHGARGRLGGHRRGGRRSIARTSRSSRIATASPSIPRGGPGKIVLEMFEKLAEHTFFEPTFVCDFPREVSPLARPHREDPALTEHFDVIVGRDRARHGVLRADRPDRAAGEVRGAAWRSVWPATRRPIRWTRTS